MCKTCTWMPTLMFFRESRGPNLSQAGSQTWWSHSHVTSFADMKGVPGSFLCRWREMLRPGNICQCWGHYKKVLKIKKVMRGHCMKLWKVKHGFHWRLKYLLPKQCYAGIECGFLLHEGATEARALFLGLMNWGLLMVLNCHPVVTIFVLVLCQYSDSNARDYDQERNFHSITEENQENVYALETPFDQVEYPQCPWPSWCKLPDN